LPSLASPLIEVARRPVASQAAFGVRRASRGGEKVVFRDVV
jgi:hypothetical protein